MWRYYANAVEFDIQIYYVLICENIDTSIVANKYANSGSSHWQVKNKMCLCIQLAIFMNKRWIRRLLLRVSSCF